MAHSLGVKEAQTKALTDELTNCRDSLQKLRDGNRSLTSTVANLQGMVNQFKIHTQILVINSSTQILHKLNGAHTTSNDAGQAQPNQQKLQPSSNTTTDKPQTQINRSGSQSVVQKQTNTLPCQDKVANDKTVTQATSQSAPNTTTTSVGSADLSPMPLERRQAFVGMRTVVPHIADTGEKSLFERTFLRATIGGGTQSLIVRFVSIPFSGQCSTEGA